MNDAHRLAERVREVAHRLDVEDPNDSQGYVRRLNAIASEIEALAAEDDAAQALIDRQGSLLTRAANVLRGEPPDNVRWSHHDIAERIEAALAEKDRRIAEVRHWWRIMREAIPYPGKLRDPWLEAYEHLDAVLTPEQP